MPQNGPQPEQGRVRLDSWKEIAEYLGRDIRTVFRWERERGLPVHTIPSGHRRSIFAYKDELDAWLARDGKRAIQELPAVAAPVTKPFLSRHRIWVAVIGAVVVLATGALVVWRSSLMVRLGLSGPALLQIAVLDSLPFVQASPDGQWLVYHDPSFKLWLREVDSGQTRPLGTQLGYVGEFAWSNDSRWVAFSSRGSDRTSRVEILNLVSQKNEVIWEGARDRPRPLDWSQDGKHLLCSIRLRDGQFQAVLLSVADRSTTPVRVVPPRTQGLRLSPDGRFVVYAAPVEDNWDIFLAPVDGGEVMRLTDHPARDMMPVWSPDGRWVVFVSVRQGSPAVWAVPTPRRGEQAVEPVYLSAIPSGAMPSTLSRDGELFFWRPRRGGQVHLLSVNPETGAPLGQPRPLPLTTDLQVGWSADARKLYYRELTEESATAPAFERNLQTGEQRTVPLPPSYVATFLAPSPDGKCIAFYGYGKDLQLGLFEYYPDTGKVARVWTPEEPQNPPLSWSPDGNELLFSSAPGKDMRFPVRALRLADGKIRTVAYTTWRPFPQWSPNGKEIAFTDGGCLLAVPRAGGSARRITCAPRISQPEGFGFMALGGLSWLLDGRKLAWTVNNEEQKRVELWIVDAASGSHVSWEGGTDYQFWPADPAWSPDGKQIAFRMERKVQYEIWRLSNFLPR